MLKTYILLKNDIYFQNLSLCVDPKWSILTRFLTYYWFLDNKRPSPQHTITWSEDKVAIFDKIDVYTLNDTFERIFIVTADFLKLQNSPNMQFHAKWLKLTFMAKPTCRPPNHYHIYIFRSTPTSWNFDTPYLKAKRQY